MNIKKKIDHIIDRIKFKINYCIANTVMKKYVDSKNNYFNIIEDEELVNKIVKEKKSFARFGDGELSLILTNKFNISFQDNSLQLNKKLKETLNSDLENMIIGINRSFNDPSIYNKKVQKYCRAFNYMYREKYKTIIPKNRIYGNSSITRFYIDYDHDNYNAAIQRVNNIKRIWNNRKILIVEGIHTRLGVGNDLFDNATKIRRILVPEKNAFTQLEKIKEEIIKRIAKDELVLIAAGPTATVLVYELAKMNIQSIDVGHIDIEYEWMKRKTKKRIAIEGKYVNEAKGKKYTETNIQDEKYKNSIISIIELE